MKRIESYYYQRPGIDHDQFQLNEKGMTACYSIIDAPM